MIESQQVYITTMVNHGFETRKKKNVGQGIVKRDWAGSIVEQPKLPALGVINLEREMTINDKGEILFDSYKRKETEYKMTVSYNGETFMY